MVLCLLYAQGAAPWTTCSSWRCRSTTRSCSGAQGLLSVLAQQLVPNASACFQCWAKCPVATGSGLGARELWKRRHGCFSAHRRHLDGCCCSPALLPATQAVRPAEFHLTLLACLPCDPHSLYRTPHCRFASLPCARLDDPVGGEHMNIMKAGIITAHR